MATATVFTSLLALDGRPLDSLTSTELALLRRYRKGRRKNGLPWISVGFKTSSFDPWAWLHAPNQAKADQIIKEAGAIVCVMVYE